MPSRSTRQASAIAERAAATKSSGASPSDLPVPANDAERTLAAAAFLAAGDIHATEKLLAPRAKDEAAPPELLLLYARAVEQVSDLDVIHRAERARSIDDKVLEKAPGAWEATIAHAKLAAVRKGASEAKIEALKDLDAERAKKKTPPNPVLDAFEAAIAGRENLHERARDALARARPALEGTAFLRDVERTVVTCSDAKRCVVPIAFTNTTDFARARSHARRAPARRR